jgi:hypothetical protein
MDGRNTSKHTDRQTHRQANSKKADNTAGSWIEKKTDLWSGRQMTNSLWNAVCKSVERPSILINALPVARPASWVPYQHLIQRAE